MIEKLCIILLYIVIIIIDYYWLLLLIQNMIIKKTISKSGWNKKIKYITSPIGWMVITIYLPRSLENWSKWLLKKV